MLAQQVLQLLPQPLRFALQAGTWHRHRMHIQSGRQTGRPAGQQAEDAESVLAAAVRRCACSQGRQQDPLSPPQQALQCRQLR
jgi:hypothetical protein